MALAFSEVALSSGRLPLACCLGPDGLIWFISNGGAARLSKYDPATDTLTEYACPDASAGLQDLCSGPDGNVWVLGYTSNKIYKVTTSGTWTAYTSGITASAGLYNICSGPDGNLWFTELGQAKVGKITTSGTVTEYSAGITSGSQPLAIGSDGTDLWFTEYHNTNGNRVCKITTAGTVTEYAISTASFRAASIVKGPDGRMWVGSFNTDKVLAVTTSTGARQEYTVTTGTAKPFFLVVVGSGLYAYTYTDQKLMPISTSGVAGTAQSVPSSGAGTQARICTDAAANIWFCEYSVDKLAAAEVVADPVAAPDAPTALAVSADPHARGVGVATLAVTGDLVTSLKVYRSQSSGGTYVEVTSNCSISVNNLAGTATFKDKRPSYGSQPIAHGATGHYKVKAINGIGDSGYSPVGSGVIDVNQVAVLQSQWDNLVAYESANSSYFQTNNGFLGGAYPGAWLLAPAYIAAIDAVRRSTALTKLSSWFTYVQTNHIDAHHIFQRPGEATYVYRDDHFRMVMHLMLCYRLLVQIEGDATAASLAATILAEAVAMGKGAIDYLSTVDFGATNGYASDWPTVAGATAWASLTATTTGTIRRPTVANGRIYRCVVGGMTNTVEPTWPTTTRGIVADNGVYWQECTSDVIEWAATTAYNVGDIVVPTTRNNRSYICTVAGTSAGSQPTWPTSNGGIVTDGGVTWKETTRSGAIYGATYNKAYPYSGGGGYVVDLNQTSEIAAALALLVNEPSATDFYTGGSYNTTAITQINAHAGKTAACLAPFGGIPVQEYGEERYDTLYGSFVLHTMAVTLKEMGGAAWDPQVWAFVHGGLDWLDAYWQTEPNIGNDVTGGHEAYASGPLNLDELAWRAAAYQIAGRANATKKLVYDSSCHPVGAYTQAGQAPSNQVEDNEIWQSVAVSRGVLTVHSYLSAVETDAAQPLTFARGYTLTPATEADTAQAPTVTRQVTLTSATGTEAAQVLALTKRAAVTHAPESDTSVSLTVAKGVSLTPATEGDTAIALSLTTGPNHQSVSIVPATELDSAEPLIFAKASTLIPASELDTATPLGLHKLVAASPASEADAGVILSLRLPIHVAIVPATELDAGVAPVRVTTLSSPPDSEARIISKTLTTSRSVDDGRVIALDECLTALPEPGSLSFVSSRSPKG